MMFWFLIGTIFGVAVGSWAMRSDIMMHHKEYFNKVKERKRWKQQ